MNIKQEKKGKRERERLNFDDSKREIKMGAK